MKRLYVVARELGVSNLRIAKDLKHMGYPVRSFASHVTEEELRALAARHGTGNAPPDSDDVGEC